MKKKLMILLSSLGIALFSGLSVAQEAPSIESRIERQGPVEDIEITDMRAVKTEGVLKVQVEFTNTSIANQQLYYRFRWLDQDGFDVGEEEGWKSLLIYGSGKQRVNVASPTFKAADFRLMLNLK